MWQNSPLNSSLTILIAKSIPLKQGLWQLQTPEELKADFYCKEYSTKTRIVTLCESIVRILFLYCKEYSTKTRIVTLFHLLKKIWMRHCKEYSTKTRIVTKPSLINLFPFWYCKEYSTKTRIVTSYAENKYMFSLALQRVFH